MKFTDVVPVLRSFDTDRATEFYLDYLGMTVDWEHRFEPGFPLYRQVSRDDLVLHLTEHHGDSTPGAAVFIRMTGVRELHAELLERAAIGHNLPEIRDMAWGAEFTVLDPFANKLRFSERA